MHWIALQLPPEPAAAQEQTLADPLTALAWRLLQFTPRVARVQDVLVAEVSASERLFGGRRELLRQIVQSNRGFEHIQRARAATSLIAIGRLFRPDLARASADDLPLAALAAAAPHLATLERIGCTRWGQLRALPRGGVVRRFDAALLDALDRAYGLKPELYAWLSWPEVFDVSLELAAQVEAAPALLFAARRLLNQLQWWLQARQRGVLALCLGWQMDPRRDTQREGELVLRTAEATRDMAHLQSLLAEHLAKITLAAPALSLRLRTVQTEALGTRTSSLLPDALSRGEGLRQLVERLSARLGPQQVRSLVLLADHRPEQMQCWKAASGASNLIAACAHDTGSAAIKHPDCGALQPSWLLAEPLRLALRHGQPLYQGALTLLAGPQRLESGWWQAADCALRDYFLARSEHAGLLWIYRERRDAARPAGAAPTTEPVWYLHGLFA